MALDNAQFIAELSITDPPGTDPLSQGDDQIRTIKRATQQSFPNIDKAVTLTGDQLNLAAIKDEDNVFTGSNSTAGLTVTEAAGFSTITFSNSGETKWQVANTNSSDVFSVTRYLIGVLQDQPITIGPNTGVVEFAHVPTIQGDPIWTAGELKMLVVGSSPPTGNWFVADGTNGTVDLRERFLGGIGPNFTGGNQGAFLAAETDAGDSTNGTALSVAQMPSHRHKLRDLQTGGGISDGTALSAANSVGSIRNVTANIFTDASLSGNLVENTGSGSNHSHTLPQLNVDLTSAGPTVNMPYAYFAILIQFVP